MLVSPRVPEGWTRYALDSSLLEVACRVNGALGRDADTGREVERVAPKGGIAQMPGFYACWAGALERLGRAAEAARIREKLEIRADPRTP